MPVRFQCLKEGAVRVIRRYRRDFGYLVASGIPIIVAAYPVGEKSSPALEFLTVQRHLFASAFLVQSIADNIMNKLDAIVDFLGVGDGMLSNELHRLMFVQDFGVI